MVVLDLRVLSFVNSMWQTDMKTWNVWGKYFSYGCGNPPSSFLRQLYDEGKLSQQQLRAVCIRIRYSAKTIMEKPVDIDDERQVDLYNYDESIVRQKDGQMAAEYGTDWEREACTPYPDFGIETEVVNCEKFRNMNLIKNHPAREGVVTPYTNYDPPDPPTSEQKKYSIIVPSKEPKDQPISTSDTPPDDTHPIPPDSSIPAGLAGVCGVCGLQDEGEEVAGIKAKENPARRSTPGWR